MRKQNPYLIGAAAIACPLSAAVADDELAASAGRHAPGHRRGFPDVSRQDQGHLQDPGTAAEDPHHAPVPGHLSHRLRHPAAVRRSDEDDRQRWAPAARSATYSTSSPCSPAATSARPPSSAWASCRTSRPRLSSSFSARLSAAGEAAKRRRERPQENQRIHPLRHRRSSACSRRSCMCSTSWVQRPAGRTGLGVAMPIRQLRMCWISMVVTHDAPAPSS